MQFVAIIWFLLNPTGKEVTEMKKAFAIVLSMIFVFAVSTLTFAAEEKKAATPAKAEMKKAEKKQITGDVTATDAKANTLTVKKGMEEVKVTTSDKTTVMAGKDKKTLADIKVGDKVTVDFMTDDKNTASKIDIKAAAMKKEEKKPAAPAKKPAAGY
jgi:hypothetical protein